MAYPNDRRHQERDEADAVSPEFLAVLVACGGEIREADRTSTPGVPIERRRNRRREDQPNEAPQTKNA